MPNTISSRVISLLAQWEERKEAGEALSPEELCKNSPELLNQVKAQLELLNEFPNHSDSTGDFDPDLTTNDQRAKTTFKDLTGTIIANRYRLTKLVGEGGMGSVWQAEQTQPVKRQVALKLIRNTSKTSAQVIRRFEAERQALALMDHPGIARIYDGGVTEWKDPYFVMELVPGVPLTEYCDNRRLSVKQRLELFVSICQAVQHAHQKGIIHRDLKPGNILVADVDSKPVPKVIDFGVAKATEQKLTEETINDFGAVVGTLAYMSPEQADASTVDIDTRTDVYALGVILFELLAGSTPLDTKQYKKMALRELLRLISDVEPPRLAAKLSSAENLPNLAATRSTEPAQLTKAVQGDLEWIVLKALEKDRTRRYETATGFATDVQRHLAGEAVSAHPPSRWYLVKKFLKRNRGPVLAMGLVTVALVVGLAASLTQMKRAIDAEVQAKTQQDLKEVQRIRAEQNAEMEREARLNEERERKYAQAIASFVKDDFLSLTSVGGQLRFSGEYVVGLNKDSTLEQLLDRAAEKLQARKDVDPLIKAELLWIIGVSYNEMGKPPKGVFYLEQSANLLTERLSRDNGKTLNALNSLAVAYRDVGKFDKALLLFEENLNLTKAVLGPDHSDTLMCMKNLAACYMSTAKLDLAIPLWEECLKISRATLGEDHLVTLTTMSDLAVGYKTANKLELALPLLEKTLKAMEVRLGNNHLIVFRTMRNLASCYLDSGKLDSAIPLLEKTVELMKAKLEADHPDIIVSINNLASCYQASGKLDSAIPLFEESMKLMIVKKGAEHPDTIASIDNLASAHMAAKNLDQAIPLMEETFRLTKAILGVDHNETLRRRNNLSRAYTSAKQFDRALKLSEENFRFSKLKLGIEHHSTLTNMQNLAESYCSTMQFDQAVLLLEETLKIQKKKLGADHTDTLNTMSLLAICHEDSGKPDRALPYYEESLRLRKAKLGVNHPDTLKSMNNLAVAYNALRHYDSALRLFEESFGISTEALGRDHPMTLTVMRNLASVYLSTEKPEKARQILEQVLKLSKVRLGPEHHQTLLTMNNLGDAYYKNNQCDRAESILRQCLVLRNKYHPKSWQTFNTQSILGAALLGQKKYSEAETFLQKGYEGMKTLEKVMPIQAKHRIPEALDRLIQLYTETNKPDEVKKWQAEKKRLTEQSPGKKE